MSRKIFVFVLAAAILGSVPPAQAQQAKVYRAGVLSVRGQGLPVLKGLRDGLKEAGYTEGKNLLLDIPLSKTYDELRPIANVYKEQRVDVIVTVGSTATSVAKEVTTEIPIVFLYSSDPVQQGFVKSMARPGTNLTGLTLSPDFEIQGKRLEVFREVAPNLRRVAVLYNARADAPHHAMAFAVVQKLAPNLGLRLLEKPVKSPSQIEPALASISKNNTDGIFMICASLFTASSKKIATNAMQKKLPLMTCLDEDEAPDAGLVLYEMDRYRLGHRGAWYVDRIFKGARPHDLPVEQPTKFEMVINLKTAKQIGLTIPPNVLARADKVIK